MPYSIPDWCTAPPSADSPLFPSYDKAPHADLTPVELDTENKTANFAGKHGNYFVTVVLI